MARVRLSEPCVVEDVRYEIGEVVDVNDNVQALNSGWMIVTDAELTDAKGRPKHSETVAAEAAEKAATDAKATAAAEKEAAKAAKTEVQTN